MKIIALNYPLQIKTQNNADNNSKNSCRFIIKSSPLLLASLLSLSSFAKADINYSQINNRVDRTSCVIKQPSKNIQFKISEKEHEPALTDEEKIHRFALFFTLIGFFSPTLINIFCNSNKKNKNMYEEKV